MHEKGAPFQHLHPLALEHVAHQEVVPFIPFLTAMKDPANTVVMFFEIATLGCAMTIAIVVVWATIVLTSTKVGQRVK